MPYLIFVALIVTMQWFFLHNDYWMVNAIAFFWDSECNSLSNSKMSTGFKQLKHDMANGPLDRSPFPFSPVPPTTPAGSAQEHRFLDACSHFGCDNRKKKWFKSSTFRKSYFGLEIHALTFRYQSTMYNWLREDSTWYRISHSNWFAGIQTRANLPHNITDPG